MAQNRTCLLVVDPDHLTRWSIRTYFDDRFDVLCSESVSETFDLLNRAAPDTVVVSDDLPDQGADDIERRARAANPGVTIIRTITAPDDEQRDRIPGLYLEKPFALNSLAEMILQAREEPNDRRGNACS